ncbi:MAG: hypothetical protein AAGA20_04440 [Planctomycetota bacterium]
MKSICRWLPLSLAFALSPAALAWQCPEYSNAFLPSGVNGVVKAQLVTGTGSQQRHVIAGAFTAVGETVASSVASFDGTNWTQVGDGFDAPLWDLAEYDDGTGTTLYACGLGFVAKLVGSTWMEWTVGGTAATLHVHDDGSGPALYVGGQFSSVGGTFSRSFARYDGLWSSMTTSIGSPAIIRALETHDDGSGPVLVIGGNFTSIGTVPANKLAQWDGASFSAFGGGLLGQNVLGRAVNALYSDASAPGGPELHVGGTFDGAPGAPNSPWVVRRQGAWVPIGGSAPVYDFAVRSEPNGDFLHAARDLGVDRLGGSLATRLPFSSALTPASLAAVGPAGAQELFVGHDVKPGSGSFLERWDGTEFVALFDTLGLSSGVHAFEVVPSATGEELWMVSGRPLLGQDLALRFDGERYEPVGSINLQDASIEDLVEFDGDMYVAGIRQGLTRWTVARLIGTSWVPVGDPGQGIDWGYGLAVFDDGNGPTLYVGGRFNRLGGPGTHSIARFDGVDWATVGGGITAPPTGGALTSIADVIVWDDGNGPALYACGNFGMLGTTAAENIARWDGTQWSPLGSGLSTLGSVGGGIGRNMAIYDSPDGEVLVVTGLFQSAGGVQARSIAAWDGSSWSAFGTGLGDAANFSGLGWGFQLAAFDPDGRGERLYVYGTIDEAGGVPVENAAVWDGTSWADAGAIPDNWPLDTAVYDDGRGRALYLGGFFAGVAGVGASGLTRLEDPCGRTLGTPVCTAESNSTGESALLRASGTSSRAANDAVFTATRLPSNSFVLLVNGTLESRGVAGDGTLCVGGLLRRMYPAGLSSATGRIDVPLDYAAPYAGGMVPGASRVFQAFFRDSTAAGFNTSDALRIVFRP